MFGIIDAGDIMSVLSAVLEKEEKRNEKMISSYMLELEQLPKGCIKPKKVNNNTYFYLIYRDGERVVSKYIGKDESSIKDIREKLIRRKQIGELLKILNKEKNDIKKMEAII